MTLDAVLTRSNAATQASARLAALAYFDGPVDAFWPLYLQTVAQALTARRVLLLTSAVGRPWQARAQWPAQGADAPGDADWTMHLVEQVKDGLPHAQCNEADELALVMMAPSDPGTPVFAVVALNVDTREWEEDGLCAWAALAAPIPALFGIQSHTRAQALSAQKALQTAAAAAAPGTAVKAESVSSENNSADVQTRAERLHDILRLSIALSQESRFMPLAMALCNELALRFDCTRVSLGWVDGHYVRLVAVSHVENFDAKSSATRALEAAMEEALEQDRVLLYPATKDVGQVLRAHQAYADALAVPYLSTVPLTRGETVDAVLCLEGQSASLSESQLWELRLMGESVSRWLVTLHAQDRWFGARWWHALAQQARTFLQPKHSALKLTGVTAVVLLCVLFMLPWAYRVDASLAIRSQDLLFMPAPFDGYLRKVHVNVGDQVASGDILVELDTRDLSLEAAMAEAELARHARESEKAMAAQQLAEMQIAAARQQQSAARLDMIRYQLGNAQVRAPYAGVVIEGDLKKNLGAPVRKGDLLLKLAQTTQSYVELEIDQIYIHEVRVGSQGEFALVGRPQERYGITLTRIDPAATHRDGRTFYLARAEVAGGLKPDWRPGMGGSAKLDAGERSLIWVMTQRTVRFLREFFWL